MAKDILAQGVAWLDSYLDENVSEDVELIQEGATYQVLATVAGENTEQLSDFGSVMINTRRQDFLIAIAELEAHNLSKVVRGSIIQRTVDDKKIKYEVCGDGNEPATRHMSRYRQRIRVHTNRIDTEVIPPP